MIPRQLRLEMTSDIPGLNNTSSKDRGIIDNYNIDYIWHFICKIEGENFTISLPLSSHRHLTEKLRSTEEALERERRLRHMQLDAIRTLWREIQKLQVNKRDGVNTPSTPMTPLTPLTPLDAKEGATGGPKKYSEESVKELTQFCQSLQGQVRAYLLCSFSNIFFFLLSFF